MGRKFVEEAQIVPIIIPIDLAAGANNGDWVSLKNHGRAVFIFVADVGTASEDPTLTLVQATSNAGANSKALNFTRVDQKEGATTLNAVGQFTRINQAAGNTYTSLTGGENEQLVVIEVNAEDLDVTGGFEWVNLTIADTGATAGKIGCVICLLLDPRLAQETQPSAIA